MRGALVHSMAERLATQNELESWRSCEARGRKHQLDEARAQRVGDARYIPCRRCPVSIRRTEGQS